MLFPDPRSEARDRVRQRALEVLSHAEAAELTPGVSPLLRLWRYPSFEASISWLVYQTGEDFAYPGRSLVRRAVWDAPYDLGRDLAQLPIPTLHLVDQLFPSAEMDRRIQALRSMTIPPFPVRSLLGVDGTTYGLQLLDPPESPVAAWWERPPTDVTFVAEWYHQFVQWLESGFDGSA